MPKKNYRQSRRNTIDSTPIVTSAPSSSRNAPVFNPDYTSVINDLKRIGVLAGSFIVILVVLSFFIK